MCDCNCRCQHGDEAETDSELDGLVYGLTKVPHVGNMPVYQKPLLWAGVVTVVFFVLNIYFW